jgi:hypothetical protein
VLTLDRIILSNDASDLFVLLFSKELQLVVEVPDLISLGWQHKPEGILSIVGHRTIEGWVSDLPVGRKPFAEKFQFFRSEVFIFVFPIQLSAVDQATELAECMVFKEVVLCFTAEEVLEGHSTLKDEVCVFLVDSRQFGKQLCRLC